MNYTDEMIEFLKGFVPGHNRKEINEAFNSEFGTDLPESTTTSLYKRLKLNTGFTGQFQKGQISPRKGMKQEDYMTPEGIERTKRTRFKKGQQAFNRRPVGSERIDKDGYIKIKIEEPDKWRHKHRVVWEQEHGPITDDQCVVMLDNDRTNCSIDNLCLVDRRTLVKLNQLGYHTEDPELTAAGINLVGLGYAIRELKEKKNESTLPV